MEVSSNQLHRLKAPVGLPLLLIGAFEKLEAARRHIVTRASSACRYRGIYRKTTASQLLRRQHGL
jgi:hypothetical protein